MARGSFTPPKRGLFALSQDEINRPSKKVKFSESLPSVPKGADVDEEDMGMLRDAFVDLINKLWRKPQYIQKAVHWLDSKVKADALRGDEDNFTSVSVLGKLDESWICAWLVANSGISLGGLETVCRKDPDTYKHLLIFALKCSLTVKMPLCCKVKSVCSSSLKRRHEDCGNRLQAVTDELLVEPTNKCANWGAIGIYEPRFVKGNPNCMEMLHRPTKHVAQVPPYVVITKEFTIKCNWDDLEAYACIGKHCKPLCELFADDCGPYYIKQWSGTEKDFDALCSRRADLHKTALQNLAVQTDAHLKTPEKFNKASKDAAKVEHMRIARQALAAKQKLLENVRQVKLG